MSACSGLPWKALDPVAARSDTARAGPTLPREPAWTGPRHAKHTLQKQQTHLVLGFPGATIHDEWKRGLEVLQTLLSGQSGRLFLEPARPIDVALGVSHPAAQGQCATEIVRLAQIAADGRYLIEKNGCLVHVPMKFFDLGKVI